MKITVHDGRERGLALAYVTLCGLVMTYAWYDVSYSYYRADMSPERAAESLVSTSLLAGFVFSCGYYWPLLAPLMRRLRLGWLSGLAVFNLMVHALVIGGGAFEVVNGPEWWQIFPVLFLLAGTLLATTLSMPSSELPADPQHGDSGQYSHGGGA